MKNENYIVIQGWMVNELKLKSNELMIYALIYGFSQDGNSYFTGSIKYIEDSLGISRGAVKTVLKNLTEKGHLKKEDYEVNNVKFCKYMAEKKCNSGSENAPRVGQKMTRGRSENDPRGGSENDPNNTIINNTNNNINDNNNEEGVFRSKLNYLLEQEVVVTNKVSNPEERELLIAWVEYKFCVQKNRYKTFRYIDEYIENIKQFGFEETKRAIMEAMTKEYKGYFPKKNSQTQVSKNKMVY